MLRRVAVVLACSTLGAVLVACDGASELTWKEDVKLRDGRVITVSRRSEFRAPHEIGQTPGESHLWIEFEHPTTGEVVHFESKLRGSTAEMEEARSKPTSEPSLMHRPYALMMKESDVYIVTWLDSTIDDFYGCPDPPFLLYRWHQGRWERRALEEIPYRRFAPNLTIGPQSERQKIESNGHHLKVEQVVFTEVGYGAVEFDFTGMTRQIFDLPPNCTSCTARGPYGPRADSPISAPTCLRKQRDWNVRNRLTN